MSKGPRVSFLHGPRPSVRHEGHAVTFQESRLKFWCTFVVLERGDHPSAVRPKRPIPFLPLDSVDVVCFLSPFPHGSFRVAPPSFSPSFSTLLLRSAQVRFVATRQWSRSASFWPPSPSPGVSSRPSCHRSPVEGTSLCSSGNAGRRTTRELPLFGQHPAPHP